MLRLLGRLPAACQADDDCVAVHDVRHLSCTAAALRCLDLSLTHELVVALPCGRVGFYGKLDGDKWVPDEEVIAEAYDVPIPG